MLFNILSFYSYILVCILGFLMIILVEINVGRVSLEIRKFKEASIYGQNHRAEQLPISERY